MAVRIASEFDNIETIKRVVENGAGMALVPEVTVRREVRDGTLVARPLEGEPLYRPTGILWRRGRVPSRAVERFIQVLAADAGDGGLPDPSRSGNINSSVPYSAPEENPHARNQF